MICQHSFVHHLYLILSLLKVKSYSFLHIFDKIKCCGCLKRNANFISLRIDNYENFDDFLYKEHYSIGMQTMRATTKQWRILKKR